MHGFLDNLAQFNALTPKLRSKVPAFAPTIADQGHSVTAAQREDTAGERHQGDGGG